MQPKIDVLRRRIGKAMLAAPLAIPLSACSGAVNAANTGVQAAI